MLAEQARPHSGPLPRAGERDGIARLARIVVPIAFGVASLALGQDANWDLYNYHWYNAFALLEGRVAIDLAPAGFQTYFNPLLDVPYYVANRYLPAPLVGFLMGCLHGLAFVLVLAIASRVPADLPGEDRVRAPLWLALAGVLTANFLSGLGNSMGDNTTALLGLACVLVIVAHWERLQRSWRAASVVALAAGFVVGLGTGLKLTNAVFALAAALALFVVPVPLGRRVALVLLFGFATLAGIATTGGYWMLEMWRTFGNPLFPQLGTLFPNPLAQPIGQYDTIWRPRGLAEALAWPFVIALDSRRVGQLTLHQVIWPIFYVLFIAWLALRAIGARTGRPLRPLEPRERFVVAFVAIGFLAWMLVFSVYRYLVAIELLAPLVIFVLVVHAFPYAAGRKIAAWTIGVATVVVLAGGVHTWGHERWSTRVFRAELPPLAEPSRTTVMVLTDDPPWAWLAPMFPREAAFVGIGDGVFDTPAYAARVRDIVARRRGQAFAIVARRDGAQPDAKAAEAYARHGFPLDAASCVPRAAYAGAKRRDYLWCGLSAR